METAQSRGSLPVIRAEKGVWGCMEGACTICMTWRTLIEQRAARIRSFFEIRLERPGHVTSVRNDNLQSVSVASRAWDDLSVGF